MLSRQTYLKIQPWIVWGLGASFFFSEYFARIAPSVMTADLMHDFSIGAEGVSIISAFFYFPYVLMQVPVGTLVDRFGAHRLLTVMALLCALGSAFFAITHTLWVAHWSRLLIGFSAAFAFVGTLKLATIWFDRNRLGLLAGLTQGLGMLGAAVGASVFSIVVTHTSWRVAMNVIALILLLVGILIGLFVRDHRSSLLSHAISSDTLGIRPLTGISMVLRNPSSWIIALYSGFIYAPTAVFAELWSVHFLKSTYHLASHVAGLAEGTIFIGLALGCPLIGWLSDHLGYRKPLLFLSGLLSLFWLLLIIFIPHLPIWLLFVALFLYGMSNAGVALSYAVAGELNPRPVAGMAIAFTNMASILLGGFFFQPLFGWLLDLRWNGAMVDGVRYYAAADFHHAFMYLPLCSLMACLLSFWIKETHARGK